MKEIRNFITSLPLIIFFGVGLFITLSNSALDGLFSGRKHG